MVGANVDMTTLPILTPFAEFAAPYLSGGYAVVKDFNTGVRNAASFQHTGVVIRNAAKHGQKC